MQQSIVASPAHGRTWPSTRTWTWTWSVNLRTNTRTHAQQATERLHINVGVIHRTTKELAGRHTLTHTQTGPDTHLEYPRPWGVSLGYPRVPRRLEAHSTQGLIYVLYVCSCDRISNHVYTHTQGNKCRGWRVWDMGHVASIDTPPHR